ncbi:hypothetical protein HDV00_000789 [Rhizophlyctis rosea]|nr:hypothetical protein HDV00_000789 [Rhizophlyctis rosea]
MLVSKASLTLAVSVLLGATSVAAQWESGPCTYHDYEGDKELLGFAYDSSPGWCGTRYSSLYVARVTAVSTMNPALCNKCLEIQSSSGSGPSAYVLAIDQKGAPGLDVAKTSFASIFPGQNPLDPQNCRWRVVDDSYCSGVCFGSPEECTPGLRNNLPAYLLPSVGSSGGGGGSTPTPQPTTQAPVVTKATTTYSVGVPATDAAKSAPTTTTVIQSTTSSPSSTSVPSNSTSSAASAATNVRVQAAGNVDGSAPAPQATALNAESAAVGISRSWSVVGLLVASVIAFC